MARPPKWRHTLDEARRQALVAVDFYNRPGDRRSFADFIVHMHLAWQNLLHADRMRRDLEIFYRNRDGRRTFARNPDGTKKTWDLSQCLKHEFDDNSPIRANITFFIGLRNHIEHRFQDAILQATASECHAYIINFESELVRRFSRDESLGHELKFPVFVQTLTPASYEEQRALRRGLPKSASNYITQFQSGIGEDLSSSTEYAYRLFLVPMKGPKTDADMALNFVRQDDLSQEEIDKLLGGEGSVIVAEKFRDSIHGDEMLPKEAAKEVERRIGFHFGINAFTQLRKKWRIGPVESGSKKQLPKSDDYCAYSEAFSQFVYRPKLVDRMAEALIDADHYRAVMGKDPIRLGE